MSRLAQVGAQRQPGISRRFEHEAHRTIKVLCGPSQQLFVALLGRLEGETFASLPFSVQDRGAMLRPDPQVNSNSTTRQSLLHWFSFRPEAALRDHAGPTSSQITRTVRLLRPRHFAAPSIALIGTPRTDGGDRTQEGAARSSTTDFLCQPLRRTGDSTSKPTIVHIPLASDQPFGLSDPSVDCSRTSGMEYLAGGCRWAS